MLMSSDRMDFAMDDVASTCSSELLDDGYISPPQPYKRTIKTEPTFSSSSDESVDLNTYSDDFTTVNPDDFLTDFFKSEVKSESNTFSPKRDTPSPSGSDSTGSDTMDYRIDMQNSGDSFRQKTNPTAQHLHFDTPPISPPSPDGSLSSDSSSSTPHTSTNNLLQRPVTARLQTVQGCPVNIVQGTLIPITTVPLNMSTVAASVAPSNLPTNFKKIKIQPKPVSSSAVAGNPIKKTGQAKTIILSAQDYSALVQKCKSQQSMPGAVKPITIKAAHIKPAVAAPIALPALPNVITPTIVHPIQIDRPPIIPSRPIVLSGMQQKISVPAPNLVQIPANPITVHPRPAIPSSCVTAVRNVVPTTSHQVRVAPRPAGGNVPPVEEKIAKKHQRMIKNRESACLSRKKKKDYMTSLETQLAQLTDSNQKLRTVDKTLKPNVTCFKLMLIFVFSKTHIFAIALPNLRRQFANADKHLPIDCRPHCCRPQLSPTRRTPCFCWPWCLWCRLTSDHLGTISY